MVCLHYILSAVCLHFTAHGLGGGFHIDQFFAEAYARAGQNYNTIGIDWRKIHNNNGLGWKTVLENVGRYAAHFVQDMVRNHGLKIEEMHGIGFSYGTHVMGRWIFFLSNVGTNNGIFHDGQ